MAPVTIRPLVAADAEGAAALYDAAAISECEDPTTPAGIARRWAEPGVDLAADSRGAFRDDGPLVALSLVRFEDPRNAPEASQIVRMLSLCVHPAAWDAHPEVPARLLQWAVAHAEARPVAAPGKPHDLGTWVYTAQVRQEALLQSFGFSHVRTSLLMRHDALGSLSPAPAVPGVGIEPWRPERDREAWAAQAEAFRDHWGFGGLNYDQFRAWFHGEGARPELWRLAVDEASGQVVGLCLTSISEEANARSGRRDGRVSELAVRRPWRRRGVGLALLVAGLLALREAGMTAATLRVDSESITGANRLYERAGFRTVLASRAYRRPIERPA